MSETIVYYGEDGGAAKIEAAVMRARGVRARARHAAMFDGQRSEDDAVIMPDVSRFDADRIRAGHGDRGKAPENAGKPDLAFNVTRRDTEDAGETIADLRSEYERVIGKRPFMGWDEPKLRSKLAEAKE